MGEIQEPYTIVYAIENTSADMAATAEDWYAAAAALPRKPPVPKLKRRKLKKKKRAQRKHQQLTLDLSQLVAPADDHVPSPPPRSGRRTARGPVRRASPSVLILPAGTPAWKARAVYSLLRRELGAARVARHPVESLPVHTRLERALVVHMLGGLPCPEDLQTLQSLPEEGDWEAGVRAVLVRHFDATPRVPTGPWYTPRGHGLRAPQTPPGVPLQPDAACRSPNSPPSAPASA